MTRYILHLLTRPGQHLLVLRKATGSMLALKLIRPSSRHSSVSSTPISNTVHFFSANTLPPHPVNLPLSQLPPHNPLRLRSPLRTQRPFRHRRNHVTDRSLTITVHTNHTTRTTITI